MRRASPLRMARAGPIPHRRSQGLNHPLSNSSTPRAPSPVPVELVRGIIRAPALHPHLCQLFADDADVEEQPQVNSVSLSRACRGGRLCGSASLLTLIAAKLDASHWQGGFQTSKVAAGGHACVGLRSRRGISKWLHIAERRTHHYRLPRLCLWQRRCLTRVASYHGATESWMPPRYACRSEAKVSW